MNIELLYGNNFSGRSTYLKEYTNFEKSEDNQGTNIYLGEIPANFLSGLAPTVRDEIALHTLNSESEITHELINFLESLSFEKYYSKNPFSLSGGEQAILTIIVALLMNPQKLAIDLTLEQINKNWRDPLFNIISKFSNSVTNICISDNRINEYNLAELSTTINKNFAILDERKEYSFQNINASDINLKLKCTNLLRLDNLSYSYRASDNYVIQNCSYTFNPGVIYHLKGANGSGKSTLSKILCGVIKADSGKIYIGDKESNTYKYPGSQIAYSFQNPDEQLFSGSVKKEFFTTKMEHEIHAELLVGAFGFSRLLNIHPADLPFVQRKRLTVACTFCIERDWYILDEPTLGQDDFNMKEIANLVKLLASNGKGVILISHSDSFIACFESIQTILLENGKF